MNEKENSNIEQEVMKYLEDVKKAINNVDKKYLLWNDITVPDEFEKMQERVFCYEFYHQFRKIMENDDKTYGNLLFNGEISKANVSDCLNTHHHYCPVKVD